MRTSSCKAKGARLVKAIKALMHQYKPDLHNDDLIVTSSGATGEDLQLSPAARAVWNLAIECKNVEKINIWAAYRQAATHVRHEGSIPVVFFGKNHAEPMVCLKAEDFIKLIT